MTELANKVAVRRLIEEVLGNGHIELLPALVAPSYVTHLPLGDQYGPEGARLEITDYRAAFPDLVVTIEALLVDRDYVVRRFTLRGTHRGSLWDIPPTGQQVTLRAVGIDRLAEGRLVESWVQIDLYPLIQPPVTLADPVSVAASDRAPYSQPDHSRR